MAIPQARKRIYASQSHAQKPLEPVLRQDMRSSFQSRANSLTATFAAVGAVTHIIHFIGHNTYLLKRLNNLSC